MALGTHGSRRERRDLAVTSTRTRTRASTSSQGVLTVEVGDERYEVGAESFVWLPREVPHVFANLGTEEVWTVGLLSSPGLTGMFREQAEYFASLQGPPDPEVLLEISLQIRVRPVEGPPLV